MNTQNEFNQFDATKEKDNKYIFGKLIIQILLLIILILTSVFLLRASVNANNILSYTEKGNIDYKVYLKENNFYKNKYLGKNMTYITSIVDYIDMTFNYNFNSSEKADVNYTYSVFANLVITPSDNSKVLYDETFIITDDISKNLSKVDKYNITKNVMLDYNFYNDLANSFNSTYGVNCDSRLYVGMKVDTNGKDLKYESEFNNSNEMQVVFSLAEKKVDINMDSSTIENSENLNVPSKTVIKSKGFMVAGIVFIILSVLVIIKIAMTINKIRNQKDEYTRYIDKILSNYDRAIVETKYIPDLEYFEVIEVSKFGELIDVRDTLRLPILYTPMEEQKSCFYIRHDRTIYIHYVTCTSLLPVNKESKLFM